MENLAAGIVIWIFPFLKLHDHFGSVSDYFVLWRRYGDFNFETGIIGHYKAVEPALIVFSDDACSFAFDNSGDFANRSAADIAAEDAYLHFISVQTRSDSLLRDDNLRLPLLRHHECSP